VSASGLAPLTADERAHEAAVVARIEAELAAAGGWLPFARYMELALYAPGLGYYAAGAHKLGAGGDFVTAPELSPVFGRCLASECATVLDALGGGDILELGAGSGALAADLLEELARRDRLPGAYRILEPSPDLRERQQRRLAGLAPGIASRLAWCTSVPAAPFRGIVLANEVLDALPVERFRVTGEGVLAEGVVLLDAPGARFGWRPGPASAALVAAIEADLGAPLPAGYVGEVALVLEPWLAAVTRPLAAGVALLVDYGAPRRRYYAPDRAGGTLACYHRQRRHADPFVNVGLQDLTASVDFTRVALAARAAGLEVAGYAPQAHVLLALGFEAHLAALRATAPAASEPLLARRAARLVLPDDMGETFKCIALARGYAGPLGAFALRDFTATL
jgi:SAM-dependent MidA family methyltransferase